MMDKEIEQNKTALLVIDVQQGLFNKSTSIFQADQLLDNINLLINKARSQRVPVIFVQHADEKNLVKGSRAWRLHPEIQPLYGEVIIHKRHGNAFIDTNLQSELEEQKVNILVIAGLVTHGCVRATSLGAIDRGYKVVLVSDAHSNYSKDANQIIKKWNRIISEKGADLVETNEVDYMRINQRKTTSVE
jgi:nicotinamidase-related amidase